MAVKKTYEVGQEVEKKCIACGAEQTHTVTSLTKSGGISKATCSVCARVSGFKTSVKGVDGTNKTSSPYSPDNTYRKGQAMMHNAFGYGEVTAVIEPQKIDVLFEDRLRRLIHAQS
ncbi:MAG TPA: hypothetical protein VEX64_00960 [Pyrinomonadaceae bacterium]|jgi:transcription elongation factor Elf1|nr:hypothetical protein [Pyrinomonadaceae bacterium]